MIKNSSSQQVVGVQMVSAADGSAFTGSVTCYVTIDGGTQAQGTVGSGACTHEGNGFHSYAPSQAETNGDHIAYTFTGSGAVPQTVQVYTRSATPAVDVTHWSNQAVAAVDTNGYPKVTIKSGTGTGEINLSSGAVPVTGDLTATMKASVNSEVDTALSDYDAPTKAELDAGLAGLNDPTASAIADAVWEEAIADHSGTAGSTAEQLSAAGAAGDPWATALPGAYTSGQAGKIVGDNLNAPVGTVDTVVDAIKAVTDNLPDSGALSSLATSAEIASLNDLDAAGIRAALGMSSANLDTQLATIHDFLDTEVIAIYDLLDTEVAAILAKVNALSSDPADQSAVEAAINAAEAAILDKLLGYVQLLARKDAGIATDRATELGEINADEGSGAGGYASTTDAQEAIRDRGDAAWTGSGGGSGPTAVEIRQEIDANSTQLAAIKTQTDALPGDPAGQSAVEAAIVSATSGLATAAALSTVDGVADAIKAKTDNLPASPAATGDIPSASTIAGAVWDTLTSALTTVGSIGKLLVDRIDAAVSSRSTYAGGDTAGTTTLLSRLTSTRAGYLDNLSGHVAQSGDAYAIVSDGAHGNAALKALIDTVDDFLDTEIAAILLDTGTTLDDFVDDLEARLTANVAAALQAHAPALGRLVVGSGSTTTAIVFGTVNDATPSSVDDHYNGRVIVFTSGALALQAVEITDYDGATKTASISQATGAPGNGTTAVIV